MLETKCIYKYRNKNGVIIGYKLIGKDNQKFDVKADALKLAIKNKKIYVTNLTLTSDDRLVDRSTKEEINAINNEYNRKAKFIGVVNDISRKIGLRPVSMNSIDKNSNGEYVYRDDPFCKLIGISHGIKIIENGEIECYRVVSGVNKITMEIKPLLRVDYSNYQKVAAAMSKLQDLEKDGMPNEVSSIKQFVYCLYRYLGRIEHNSNVMNTLKVFPRELLGYSEYAGIYGERLVSYVRSVAMATASKESTIEKYKTSGLNGKVNLKDLCIMSAATGIDIDSILNMVSSSSKRYIPVVESFREILS